MRDAILNPLFVPVSRVKGVGPAMSEALSRLLPAASARVGGGLPIVRDLLFHLPHALVDRTKTYPLREAPEGVVATFVVTVIDHLPPKNPRFGKAPYKVICGNETGEMVVAFFNARPDYIKQALPIGEQRVISGRVEHFDYQVQMTHPDIIAPVSQLAEVQKPEAVYPLTAGLTSRKIAKIVDEALAKLPELPPWREAGGVSFKQALMELHHPQTPDALSPDNPARLRLVEDEIFAHQLQLELLRRKMQAQPGRIIKPEGKFAQALREALPFSLTAGQEKVISEIAADMASGRRMVRLLQGDVGSGKTVVALASMLSVAECGFQSALMAPTELIARQHYQVISKIAAEFSSPLEGEDQGGGWGEHGYSSRLTERAKASRKEQTEAEKSLWNILRSKQLAGYKFRRQQPIGNYIVDFLCAEERLIIELDGGQHAQQETYDNKRTQFLEARGYRVLRFWNHEVLANIEGVYEHIVAVITTPHPTLPLKGGGLEVVLLTGSVIGKEREEALAKIASGEAEIVIGTHALFQEKVVFDKLALAVIDEQHRFGVAQRMALSQKGETPHLLHMTATPIPRSLTMMLYGDMDSSLLTEKPQNRKPITTRLIPRSRYEEVVSRLQAALERGEKAYWICPLVEESSEFGVQSSDASDLAAVQTRFTEFKARFGDIVSLVHGRMRADERNEQMQKFADGRSKLLVATTVVEVGVDVRDATIIVIEQAERFGLSQLHQLRGRVGRGERESACVLLYSEVGSGQRSAVGEEHYTGNWPLATDRLSILRETEDGFKIAEEDLKQRGGGELLGVRQSGQMATIFVDLQHDIRRVEAMRREVQELLSTDPTLSSERGKAAQLLLQLFEREVG